MGKRQAMRALKRQRVCEFEGYTLHVLTAFIQTGEVPGLMTAKIRRDNKRARRWAARP